LQARKTCHDLLAQAVKEKATYWKQRSKSRAVKEGDANTAFHHAQATVRMRSNNIRYVEVQGSIIANHDGKLQALTDFFSSIIGQPGSSSWHFDVEALFHNHYRPADELVAPFSEQETIEALKTMDRNSAPGPDGFGPSFYRAAWGTIKHDVMAFLSAFHQGQAQLERINRSYMVLIPKKPGAVAVDAFRPICLQNCSIKILGKVLTRRLQKEIGQMIDLHQTGFLQGRSISETFVFAAEVVQACHKRKLPSLVLKLDFAKAFDTVNWDGLNHILRARGFHQVWCNWMQDILSSSKSAVLVNGCPGRWINCKRGLRQGDPLSPYLFLLVADTLQALIKTAAAAKHPIDSGAPPVVLQYADDTLIVLQGEVAAAQELKSILHRFSEATGLKINFSKSTMVPIHMEQQLIQQCTDILGCSLQTFPQNYLGLPLSAYKLPQAAFATYVDKTDRFLSSWQASVLNNMGRVVLINSVLDSQLVYIMSATQIPPEIIKQIDRRRRAFLWSGDKETSPAKCLVAWPNVCTTKDLGGLGIRDFGTQNICLLLSLIHRLHCAHSSAWASWIKQRADIANMRCEGLGQHWELLRSLLPLYQALTTVQLGDGRTTLFWSDVWTGDDALADRFPRLYSHCKLKDSTVQQALGSNLHGAFVNRLSPQAQQELIALTEIVHLTCLNDEPDKRLSQFSRTPDKLDTSTIYRLLKAKGQPNDPASIFIWKNAAPPRVQLFAWLLVKGRIQCKANLYRKKIVDSPACTVCGADQETPDHIILHCPFAAQFWSTLGLQDVHNLQTKNLHCFQKLQNLPADQYSAFIILCCWQLWKRRNEVVFRDVHQNLRTIIISCRSEAFQWKVRMPKKSKMVIQAWSSFLEMTVNNSVDVI
jgi:hypothetical protein